MDLTAWLLTYYGQEQMNPGLDRIKLILKDIFPELNKLRIVIIAGTNGKGETTLRLSELLKSHRHCTWTSPHIIRLTERFRNEEGEIDQEVLEKLILECHKQVEEHQYKLSYYEFLFFVFCTWAQRQSPEFLLLEVGLGGRLDAVNVFDAEIVLLPSISRDHQEILGRRYDQILKEKLGTLRPRTSFIHFLDRQYLIERARSIADSVGARTISLNDTLNIPDFDFSRRNLALATAAFCQLFGQDFSQKEWNLVPGLENRGEVVKGSNEWFFYGSHNVDGMRKLIQFLHSETYNFKRSRFDTVIAAFSKRDSSDLKVMMRMLSKSGLGNVVVTTFDHPKAATVAEIEKLSREEGLSFVKDIENYVHGQNKNQRMLVTGSYYFLGYFKSLSCL
jgi:dihydrofolate synthase/folylpolyglutamate synthase